MVIPQRIVLLAPSAAAKLARHLTDVQHQSHDRVVSTLHVHVDHDNCLEVIILARPHVIEFVELVGLYGRRG